MSAQETPYQAGLFGATYQTHYRLNDTEVSNARRSSKWRTAVNGEPQLLLTTIKLEKDDKVFLHIGGYISKFYDPKTTYFEGRLVTIINE